MGNKRNLMETAWELELDGKSSPHHFKEIRNIPWGGCLQHPIGSPIKKIRNISLGDMLVLLTSLGFILRFFSGTKLLG